jgi:polyisoprenoid-binding protein YceI
MKHMILVALCLMAQTTFSQKYFSKAGKVSIISDAPLEKIEAHNTTASTVIDISTGAMEWGVLIKSFAFEKALMQEHFNENYMESATYPKAKFKGQIDNLPQIKWQQDGEYPAEVSGQLEIHGVTQPVKVSGKIKIHQGKVSAQSQFVMKVADYGIEIPKVVAENISKTVTIHVEADYQLLTAVR